MSEVNVRKWHGLISPHFSSKIGHVKIKLETTLVLEYFYTVCIGRSRPFCICIRCESRKWRFYGKPLEYKLTTIDQSVIMLVASFVKLKQQPGTMANYNNRRQSMSVNE